MMSIDVIIDIDGFTKGIIKVNVFIGLAIVYLLYLDSYFNNCLICFKNNYF